MKKPNVPQKGAAKKWAARLKDLGKQKPPQDLVEKINNDENKKSAIPARKNDLDL